MLDSMKKWCSEKGLKLDNWIKEKHVELGESHGCPCSEKGMCVIHLLRMTAVCNFSTQSRDLLIYTGHCWDMQQI